MHRLGRKGTILSWILAVCCVFTISTSCEDKDPYDPYANFDHAAQAKMEDELIQEYLKVNNITQFTKTASGLYYVVTEPGTGARPVAGQKVEVGYVGKLIHNGYIFDSSYARAETFKFTLGQREVIPGWEEGIPLMRKGEKALLLIPSRLAYGLTGSRDGSIRPNTPIMFDIHLMNF